MGYFEDSEALQEQQENEPNVNDPRLTQPIGIYHNLGRVDQKPTCLSLRLTEIPIPPRALKGEGTKQYALPEPIPEVDSMLSKVEQEIPEPMQDERPLESERLTQVELLKSSSTIRLCSSEARVFLFPPTSQREFCHSSLTKWAPHLHASAMIIKNQKCAR